MKLIFILFIIQNNNIKIIISFQKYKKTFSHRIYPFLLQNFIQSQLSYFYWVGLSRKGTRSPWKWEDKLPLFLKLQVSRIDSN